MLPERVSRALQITLGIGVSAALIWWSFHRTDFATVWSYIRTVQIAPLLIAVTLATIPFPMRIPRWKLLLRRADGSTIPNGPLWHAISIGFAANNVLPLRAGELLRAGAIDRLANVSFAAALSSIAMERVLDALAVITLLAIGLMTSPLPPDVRIGNGAPIAHLAVDTGIACLGLLFLAVLAAWQREMVLRMFARVLPSHPFSRKLVGFVDRVLSGIEALRDPRRAVPMLAWSLLIWVINAAGFYAAFRAFGFHVPFAGALVVQGALSIGIAVPSSPAFVGVFETIIPGTLVLYGVDPVAALACAVAYHVTTFVPITFLGAVSAIRAGAHLKAPQATP